MKKISTLLLAFALIFNVSASNADLFSYDLSEISTELSDLKVVEKVISLNQNSTIVDLNTQITNNKYLSSTFDTNYKSSLALRAGLMDDMDWGSFAWGFCCWPIGFFVVITNKDKEQNQKKSYWVGLGTSAVLSIITQLAALAAA